MHSSDPKLCRAPYSSLWQPVPQPLHVQRARATIRPAVASAIVAPPTASLIDTDPEAAKAAGRARRAAPRQQKAFTDKLGTLGGVEGQVMTVGGAAAQDSREKGLGRHHQDEARARPEERGPPEQELGARKPCRT